MEKVVKMSHVEILEVDDTHRQSKVFFYPETEIIDPLIKTEKDAPEKIYKTKRDIKPSIQTKIYKFVFGR